ncbi:MAG: PilZ domain-containing protein [Acidobacteria bacterium]|nr:PilZ domain-containing protein [Acidobacteriota bacterium]MCZ6750719.1 PilZ domain-containing protein [Acidobacteriota bacterium]
MKSEKRRYRRYVVSGEVKFRTEVDEAVGELVHIGRRGILIRSHFIPPLRTNLSIHFTVQRYGETFRVGGRVVGSEKDLIAVNFSVEPAGMEELLQWLDKREKSKVARASAP